MAVARCALLALIYAFASLPHGSAEGTVASLLLTARRHLVDQIFSLNIPGWVSVDVAAPSPLPPRKKPDHKAGAPGPIGVSVSVDVPQVKVDVNGKHKQAATPGPAPSPSVWTKPGVDVTVGGRRLQDSAEEAGHVRKLEAVDVKFPGGGVYVGPGPGPAPGPRHGKAPKAAVSVELPGGSVDVSGRRLLLKEQSHDEPEEEDRLIGRKLQHDVVTSFPGGSVKVNAPVVAKGPAKAPAPLVDVKFPTGGVTVGSDGVHVDWGNGAGAVNVGGRKLLRGSSVASTIPAAAPVKSLGGAKINVTLPALPPLQPGSADLNVSAVTALAAQAIEAIPQLAEKIYPFLMQLRPTATAPQTSSVWESAFTVSVDVDVTVSPARRLMQVH